MTSTIATVGASLDTGLKRSHNEDNLCYRQATGDQEARGWGDLFVVADGMGGHAAGEVASKIAVDRILASYYAEEPADVAANLTAAIKLANKKIFEQAAESDRLAGMGTTCVCSVIHGDRLFIAHVGDSRAYLFRKGVLTGVTGDHSWVEEQVRRGLLAPEAARGHPMRNVITRALGSAPDVEVDLSVRQIDRGDVLLLCSDGLTTAVEDCAIQNVIATEVEPQMAADALVDLANGAGGPDNIGIIVVRIDQVVPLDETDGGKAEVRPRRWWSQFFPRS
ncbi:MAG: Stp1/IreP family PP2C-type Ser/Thr phosphatase [Chloroflexi bacterium]|nr:Stp1/IreP family PP2C-type Ser/Thr phosphatase [Chloroflexota bacterium]